MMHANKQGNYNKSIVINENAGINRKYNHENACANIRPPQANNTACLQNSAIAFQGVQIRTNCRDKVKTRLMKMSVKRTHSIKQAVKAYTLASGRGTDSTNCLRRWQSSGHTV
eukprot:1443-Heterococcus_DN1.PRE.9